ncbi:MAG: nitroreductase family protein [Bacteroidota bacterium]
MNTIFSKTADTTADLHPLISKRWSPRSFSEQEISEDLLMELLEAARWAASSNNEQPWEFVYTFRGTDGFDSLLDTLMPGNKKWADNAAVLVLSIARKTFARNGRQNLWSRHDLGMANAQMVLQAAHRNIYAHMMAGFDRQAASTLLNLSEDQEALVMTAFGYVDDPSKLDEALREREIAPRNRKPLADIARQI